MSNENGMDLSSLERSLKDLGLHLPRPLAEMTADEIEELVRLWKAKSSPHLVAKNRQTDFSHYLQRPNPYKAFAEEVLKQTWWWKQDEIGQAIHRSNRIVVYGAHGCSKTQTSGGVVTAFLHMYPTATVITTAPGKEQVLNETWREIRKQIKKADCLLLPGLKPKESFWDVDADRFAQGYSTDTFNAFRGKHGENMLFVFEEAQGIPEWALEEAINMCTSPNNKIVVMFNPVIRAGWTYEIATNRKLGWTVVRLNAMEHPNVVTGKMLYPGGPSRAWIDERVQAWCQPIEPEDVQTGDFQWPENSGVWWRPGPTFQCRVLGQFPDEGEESLIPLTWIQNARTNAKPIDTSLPVDIGMDVAYSGGDSCVVVSRIGPSLIGRRKWQGRDPAKSLKSLCDVIKGYNEQGMRVGQVAIDAIGIGSGVAYGLMEKVGEGLLQVDRVLPVMVSERANNAELYTYRREELAYELAERFRQGQVDGSRYPKEAMDDFEAQAVQIERKRDSRLRHTIDSKDVIRQKYGHSPDDFDAMVLCYMDSFDCFADSFVESLRIAND